MPRERTKILLVEDSSTNAQFIRAALLETAPEAYAVEWARTHARARAALQDGGIDAVILDLTLPDADGLQNYNGIHDVAPEVPVVVLTGRDDESLVRSLLQAGVQDYLTKRDVTGPILQRSLRYAVDRKQAERELSQSRKLEAIGQLAAGIAHEINTPVQYVGDSITFLEELLSDYQRLVDSYRGLINQLDSTGTGVSDVDKVKDLEEEIDLEFAEEEAPKAFERCQQGIERVATIVRAMKEFSHPATSEKEPSDLNRAIENTVTVATNEYRYVADVKLELGGIPLVPCHIGEINQVLLNLVVNASHAIGDLFGESGSRGTITIRSRSDEESVTVEVEDTGCGIPEDVRSRVFDPFFTTKQVGRGTGQGLSLAHAIITEKHHGTIDFTTRIGEGTTFRIVLPLQPVSDPEGAPA